MITNNADVERLIFDEARRYYPELFGAGAAAGRDAENLLGRAGVSSPVFNGFEAWPLFLDNTPAPLPAPLPRSGIAGVRDDFPILNEKVNGKNLIWFDNAATTQKPQCVIDRLRRFYEHENSNVHRGAHTLARRSTDAYEGARRAMAEFLGASSPDEIVFVRGTTEGINLVARAWGEGAVSEGDEILVSELEHHANIVPWQFLCRKTGAVLRSFPVDDTGQVLLPEYKRLLSRKTKLVAFAHVSNVLGTITPAEELTRLAHEAGALVLIDGAQAAAHLPVDVRALGADFYVFSGHKIFGPTGVGVLYGRYALLDGMAPYQGGGNMIEDVTMAESRFKKPPHKFEAGTGNIADAVGLESAVRYVAALGLPAVERYEHELLAYMAARIQSVPGLVTVGSAARKSGIVSFYLRGIDSDDAARYLDGAGIAVRAGHHCAQPVLRRFGLEKIVRASLAVYNTPEEIDAFIDALKSLARRGT
ncbi:cysteine desulfurases, SufSfamily [Sporobacter termitidis DSM 10068]|uniref:cysteine desulfurase n=1 Tax=Sporobacter termitidis DSM 10068 TaxID=1123282 RepID=A0A1M5ZA52_9FIRM|nr:cysteine desulfurase [Sporobacter termitidis]SHI21104.1 cysteine desulfurases, SufSfamily [Sporobacter termitidis DSM 10068]